MKAKIKVYYYNLTESVFNLYDYLGINCYAIYRGIETDKPTVLIVEPADSPINKRVVDIKTKNIDENKKYLVDVAKKLFNYVSMYEDELEKEDEADLDIDIDPEIAKKIESVEIYNISEYDYALLFVFNLR